MDNVELKKKVTLKRKSETPASITPSQPKKNKWWLWLLPIVILGAVILIIKSNSSGKDNASIVETESVPVEQAQVTNDAAMSVTQTASLENSQSNNEQNQVTTTPSGSGQPVASDNPSKTASDAKTNNESVAAATAVNTQKPINSVQTTVSGVDAKAWEVIKGRFGNGEERKQTLGAEYESIQRRVNELYKSGQVQ